MRNPQSARRDGCQPRRALLRGRWPVAALRGALEARHRATGDDRRLPRQALQVAQAGLRLRRTRSREKSFAGERPSTRFWGTELHFQRLPGVLSTCVGYTQGDVERPTYGEVCTGGTKHTEGIQLCFDPAVCSYEALCQKLLSTVDSTALNRVGNDRGTQ